GLTHEDLLQEDRLGTFLARYYNVSIDSKHENTAVFLQDKDDSSMCSVSSITDPYDQSPELEVSPPPSPEPDISPSTTPELELPSPPTSEVDSSPPTPIDNPWTVITRMFPFFQRPSRGLTIISQVSALEIYPLAASGSRLDPMFQSSVTVPIKGLKISLYSYTTAISNGKT
ncbi:hypothetical protein EV363DRAFT_1169965, partial [Boletus edulis]